MTDTYERPKSHYSAGPERVLSPEAEPHAKKLIECYDRGATLSLEQLHEARKAFDALREMGVYGIPGYYHDDESLTPGWVSTDFVWANIALDFLRADSE